jgi:hypothetical protein
MSSKNSPGGSIFPYFYKDGELFGAHYESFGSRETALLERMKAEEEFFLQQNHPLPYWVNFYGTNLTENVATEFVQSFKRLESFIPKLAIVGCSGFAKRRFERNRKKWGLMIPLRYFGDPEEAKSWLVGKG